MPKRSARGIDWESQPLGEERDVLIAARLGCTPAAVQKARRKRGIPRWRVTWTGVDFASKTNRELATELECGAETVRKKRAELGLGPLGSAPKRIEWGAWPLGERTDVDLARAIGCSREAVARARKKRGIAAFRAQVPDWDAQRLGEETDRAIAERLGVSIKAVRSARLSRGIPSLRTTEPRKKVERRYPPGDLRYPGPKGIDWKELPLGRMPDSVIADVVGCARNSVLRARRVRGIPIFPGHHHGEGWPAEEPEQEPLAELTSDELDRALAASTPSLRLMAEPADMRIEASERIRRALRHLKERERVVIELRFGLNGHEDHTLEEIARIRGVSRERIRQIETKALRKMRALFGRRASRISMFSAPHRR